MWRSHWIQNKEDKKHRPQIGKKPEKKKEKLEKCRLSEKNKRSKSLAEVVKYFNKVCVTSFLDLQW